ncbi:MAG: chemotaxis protein CheX [Oscillospiraceae bacterium]|nr:chemotaxis protein CheX [Oscillospiraceae bacterium]
MFTQFFGNYLLQRQLVSPEHLSEVLQTMKDTRPQLGVLAINAGLMTAVQVEKAHLEQTRADKRIGDVMVDMGYISRENVEKLLKSQPAGHLILGQALVDNGYMTTSQFEQALSSYKTENSISDADFGAENDASAQRLVRNFYHFNSISGAGYMTGYVSLLFKNLIRFIGSDFTPMDAHALMGALSACAAQRIDGGIRAVTIIDADASAMIEFASRFTNKQLTAEDDYTHTCISNFINLHNGIFAENMSAAEGIKLKTEPQRFYESIDISELSNACVIPVCFSFGMVNFIVAM